MSIKPIFFDKINNHRLLISDPKSTFTDFQYSQLRIDQLSVIDFLTENYRLSILSIKHAGVRMIPVSNGVTNRSVSLSVVQVNSLNDHIFRLFKSLFSLGRWIESFL